MSQEHEQQAPQTAEDCAHDCSSCQSACASRSPESLLVAPHPLSRIGRVIAVMSGKGGVGKSSVTACLASAMQKRGLRVGVLDGDITGPSIPQAFGVHAKAEATERGLLPEYSEGGVAIMSLNLLLNQETDPVIWRGSILSSAVKQFWTDVIWGDLDYLFIDMPPGTGDVPMTVMQSLPIDGIIVVTTPQDLVSMIVAKAINMANLMHKPLLGIVENYSFFICDSCDKKHHIFGESKLDALALDYDLPILARLPLDPRLASAMDGGLVEKLAHNPLDALSATLATVPPKA